MIDGASLLGKPLTERELVVCSHIVAGETNREIGIALGISRRTVDVHRERIYRKMGVDNAVKLTLKVMQQKETA